ncbi:MAG: acetate--CoA ligase family protein [Candidatus Beckwithbacteria bacterium]|nr:acetate--CoA ligase family protein [Candidatus Beckwithbacteria bacterium]
MNLFSPRSIAVVGASPNKSKLGYQIFSKLLNYSRPVYPVNPKYKHVLNRPCFASVTAIPDSVDQVVIVIPAAFIPLVISNCLNKKVNSVIIISSGFSEIGPAGSLLEGEIKAKIANSSLEVLGPNCLGYAHPQAGLDLTFAKTAPPAGNISLVTQSGAIGSFLFDWAKTEHLGFSKFASLGNRIGITENGLLSYLSTDKNTKVIGLYLESFADPAEFLKIASRVSRIKPIVVIFGGLTTKGKVAAQSHTAALSPDRKIVNTLLEQAGCLQVDTLEEFADLLEIFSLEPPLTDNDLAIVTNAGGPGILATDSASQFNLDVIQPLDVFGDALTDRFVAAFNQVIKDHIKDAFLIILTPQAGTQLELTCQTVVDKFKHVKKPVVVSLLGGRINDAAKEILRQNKIATIDFPQSAVKYLSLLFSYWHHRNHRPLYPVRSFKTVNRQKISLPSGQLSWHQISQLAKIYYLPLIKTVSAKPDNLIYLTQELGFPIVLKTDSSAGYHRTENKAIYLNLKSLTAVKTAFKKISHTFTGILAQPQISEGHELFIGMNRQPGYPALLTFGSGGIYTELYQDIVRTFLPTNQTIILNLIKQTKLGQILLGARGLPPIDLKPVIKLILNLSQLVSDYPQIQTIDINPAIISPHHLDIVDIKITTSPLTLP